MNCSAYLFPQMKNLDVYDLHVIYDPLSFYEDEYLVHPADERTQWSKTNGF